MSIYANPLNPAAQALLLAQQALDAANEAKAAAAKVFPKVTLQAPTMLAGLKTLTTLAWFSSGSNASEFSDVPAGLSSGYGFSGMFVPNDGAAAGNGMVVVWQSRLPSMSGDGGIWFRNIRDGAWGYNWRMILSQY